MARLSFHAPGKISCKMQEMVREIGVQVRQKVRELFFLQIFVGTLFYGLTFSSCSMQKKMK